MRARRAVIPTRAPAGPSPPSTPVYQSRARPGRICARRGPPWRPAPATAPATHSGRRVLQNDRSGASSDVSEMPRTAAHKAGTRAVATATRPRTVIDTDLTHLLARDHPRCPALRHGSDVRVRTTELACQKLAFWMPVPLARSARSRIPLYPGQAGRAGTGRTRLPRAAISQTPVRSGLGSALQWP